MLYFVLLWRCWTGQEPEEGELACGEGCVNRSTYTECDKELCKENIQNKLQSNFAILVDVSIIYPCLIVLLEKWWIWNGFILLFFIIILFNNWFYQGFLIRREGQFLFDLVDSFKNFFRW